MSELIVEVDHRIRLVSAVLAASRWPELEQAEHPHAVHAVARQTREYVSDYADHPAVVYANNWIADGRHVDDLYSIALRCSWPFFDIEQPLLLSDAGSPWPEMLADFYTDTAIAAFLWADHEATVQGAVAELRQLLQHTRLATFLGRLRGRPLTRQLRVVPNLAYPALRTCIGHIEDVSTDVILPPPKAVGESPPWSYSQGSGWVLAELCRSLVPVVMAEHLYEAYGTPEGTLVSDYLRHGATVLFLQDALDEAAAMAYLVQKRKQADMPQLAAVADGLRDYLEQPNGRSSVGIVEEMVFA